MNSIHLLLRLSGRIGFRSVEHIDSSIEGSFYDLLQAVVKVPWRFSELGITSP